MRSPILAPGNRRTLIAAIAATLTFCGAIAVTSGRGPGLDPDSLAYVGAATSLASHGKLEVPFGKWQLPDSTIPLTVWPPGFSTAMAIPQLAGIPPLTAARIVIALAASVTAATVVLLFSSVISLAGATVGLLVILVTPAFLDVHTSVLSEPLFLACLAIALFGMVRERPLVAGLGSAAAVLTRYAGVSAGAAGAIWFLFFDDGAFRERVRRALLAAGPSVIAFAAWMIHNARVTIFQSRIKVAYRPGILQTIRNGWETTLQWIAPGLGYALSLGAIIIFFSVVVAALVARRRSAEPAVGMNEQYRKNVSAAAAVLLVFYLVTLVLSRIFVGDSIPFDSRLLSPAFMLIEITAIPILWQFFRISPSWMRAAAASALLLWLAGSVMVDAETVEDAVVYGNDFASTEWRTSPTVEWVINSGKGKRIFTNWPAAVYFDAHRSPFDLPTVVEADSIARFRERLASENGVVVGFDARNPDYPPNDSLASAAGLIRLERFSDGAVWALPSRAESQPNRAGSVRK